MVEHNADLSPEDDARVRADLLFISEEVEIAEGIMLRRDGEDWLIESTTANTGLSLIFTTSQVEALIETIQAKLSRERELNSFAAQLRARDAQA
jgi:hypothetical protein